MFGMAGEEEAELEQATEVGRGGDAQAFSFGDKGNGWMVQRGRSSDGPNAKEEDRVDTVSIKYILKLRPLVKS